MIAKFLHWAARIVVVYVLLPTNIGDLYHFLHPYFPTLMDALVNLFASINKSLGIANAQALAVALLLSVAVLVATTQGKESSIAVWKWVLASATAVYCIIGIGLFEVLSSRSVASILLIDAGPLILWILPALVLIIDVSLVGLFIAGWKTKR